MDFNSISHGIKANYRDPISQKLSNDTLYRAQYSSQRPASDNKVVKTVDKLLEKLSQLLDLDIDAPPPTGAADEEQPLEAAIQLAEEVLALLDDIKPNEAASAIPDASEVKRLLDQYLALMQALDQLDDAMDNLSEAEAESLEQMERMARAQRLLEQLAELYDRRLKRMSEAAWYTQWRQTYRDEMETKTNLRNELNEAPISTRSLPAGVDAASAHAALNAGVARPDLEHGSQVLQDLSHDAPPAEKSPYA